MQLAGTDGTRLELSIVGYEFREAPGSAAPKWDLNWLTIWGRLELPDGRRHEFRQPCLTTWESRRLAEWLDQLSAGEPAAPDISFTEPCLTFSTEPAAADAIIMRVTLSAEAVPPAVRAAGGGPPDHHIRLELPVAQLEQARQQWLSQLEAFPVR